MAIFQAASDINRFRQIVYVLIKHGFGQLVEKLGLTDNFILNKLNQSKKTEREKTSIEKRIFLTVNDLGPTFIKFGQVLSTRDDMLPVALINELKNLQDSAGPLDFSTIRTILTNELGDSIENLFNTFDEKPVASASIAQVHRATLHDNTEVVVKVQRPEIKDIIESDIDILFFLARMLEKRVPEFGLYQLSAIVTELEKAITNEIDFTNEAENIERFRKNFEGIDYVITPHVYKEYSTKKVLTMDYIDGAKITDFEKVGADPKVIARRGNQAIFKQIYEDGFFHSDPHPGNIFVNKDNKIIFLDFGQVGRLTDELREKILMLVVAIVREDKQSVASILYSIGIKEKKLDLSEFRIDVDSVLDNIYGKALKDIEFGKVFKQLVDNARKHRMKIPPPFFLMIKSILTMETIGRALDPEMNAIEEAKPFIMKLMWNRWTPDKMTNNIFRSFVEMKDILGDAPQFIGEIIKDLREGEFTVNVKNREHARISKILDASSLRVTLGLVISALIVASSMIVISGKTNIVQPYISVIALGMFTITGIIALWIVVLMIKTGRLK